MNILGDNTFLAKMRIFSMIYGFKMADGDTGVRKRKRQNADKLLPEKDSERTPEEIDKKSTRILKRGTFWLTRIVLLRYIGFIYCKSDHAGSRCMYRYCISLGCQVLTWKRHKQYKLMHCFGKNIFHVLTILHGRLFHIFFFIPLPGNNIKHLKWFE